ncbi:MAG: hypothetical protein ACM3WU_09185 [Bacillota bacterium]
MAKKAALLIPLIAAVLVSMTLTSCSSATPPNEVVEEFLKLFKAAEYEKMASMMVAPREDFDFTELQKSVPQDLDFMEMIGRMTYKVGQPTINGDRAEVVAEITAVDLATLVEAVIGEYLPLAMQMAMSGATQEEIAAEAQRIFGDKMTSISDMRMVTNEVTFSLTKVQGKWLIEFDEEGGVEFLNGVFGGLGDVLIRLGQAFGQ